MRGYETWSFGNRPFLFALALSVLWHFFWFFLVTIDVEGARKPNHLKPKIVSLGPVIDDTIFRMLAETRPQLSETFYRHLDDFAPAIEVKPQVLERREPGEVVSLSSRRGEGGVIRDLVGGLKLGYTEETGRVEGPAAKRSLWEKPSAPVLPEDLKASAVPETVVRFVVNPAGVVSSAEVLASSGRMELDELWVSWIKRWKFEPLPISQPALDEEGRVRCRFPRTDTGEPEPNL